MGEVASPDGSRTESCRWRLFDRVCEVDCFELIAERRGACFHDLFINDFGLFVYFQEHLILCFHAMCRETDGMSVLYVYEDD